MQYGQNKDTGTGVGELGGRKRPGVRGPVPRTMVAPRELSRCLGSGVEVKKVKTSRVAREQQEEFVFTPTLEGKCDVNYWILGPWQ